MIEINKYIKKYKERKITKNCQNKNEQFVSTKILQKRNIIVEKKNCKNSVEENEEKNKYSWMRAKSDGGEQLVEGQGLWGEKDVGEVRQKALEGAVRRGCCLEGVESRATLRSLRVHTKMKKM